MILLSSSVVSDGNLGGPGGSAGRPAQPLVLLRRLRVDHFSSLSACNFSILNLLLSSSSGGNRRIGVSGAAGGEGSASATCCACTSGGAMEDNSGSMTGAGGEVGD